ncbi:MAG: NUDIX domain-containing protein [Chloroflexi bacterium]|nr:NUDIX domain-containing protein [Chloroflexota bacterium]
MEKSAGAVVFYRGAEIEYLLIRSTYWEFPKGLIDVEENERDAARREVREETGLDAELYPDFKKTVQYFYRRRENGALVKKYVVYFLGEAKTRDVQISWEHQEAQWLTYERALEFLPYENAREILRAASEWLSHVA